eukprot:m.122390 g.122390  ORF g.122390 m.122390 type:complete len:493 (+) comp17273_c0_seq4:270-1748(+)
MMGRGWAILFALLLVLHVYYRIGTTECSSKSRLGSFDSTIDSAPVLVAQFENQLDKHANTDTTNPLRDNSQKKGRNKFTFGSHSPTIQALIPPDVTSDHRCVYKGTREDSVPDAARKVQIVAVGDVSFARDIREYGDEQRDGNFSYVFDKVRHIFHEADLVIVNLESPLYPDVEARSVKSDGIVLKGSEKGAEALRDAGVGVCTLAHNHILDLGRDGVQTTSRLLQTHKILPVGVQSREYGYTYGLKTINGVRIALYAFCLLPSCEAMASKHGFGPGLLDKAAAARLIEMRKVVDVLIVSMHWGLEYSVEIEGEVRRAARLLADIGVNIVLGHHPHVLRDHAIIGKTLVAYSLGNFVFDSHVCRDANGVISPEGMQASPACRRMHARRRRPMAHASRLSRIYRITATTSGVQSAEYLPCEIGTEVWTTHSRSSIGVQNLLVNVTAGYVQHGGDHGTTSSQRQNTRPIYRPVPTEKPWIEICSNNDSHCAECV